MKATGEGDLGLSFVEDLRISECVQDFLFLALILTALGILVGGNLLLLNASIVVPTARVGVASLTIVAIFYSLSKLSRSVVMGLAATYAVLVAVVYIGRLPGLWYLVYGLSLAAFAYMAATLRVARRMWPAAILMALIGSLVMLGITRPYTTFDMMLRINAGNVHQDTLFHASIAAMIKNYGVSSTGLNGLVVIPYHTLSHALMAFVSLFSGVSVLETYGVASWVLFGPLLLFCITAAVAALDREETVKSPLVWGLAACSLALLPKILRPWAVWNSYFVSESYLVSLGLFLLALAHLFKHRLGLADVLLAVLLAVLLTASKGSVGAIYAGLWIVRAVLLSKGQRAVTAGIAVLTVLALVVDAARSAEAVSGSTSFSILAFVRDFSWWGSDLTKLGQAVLAGATVRSGIVVKALAAVVSFWFFHFLPAWAFVGYVVWRRGAARAAMSPAVVYSMASVAAGTLMISFLSIPGGADYYFSNVSFFVALPFAIVVAALYLQERFGQASANWLIGVGAAFVAVSSLSGYYHWSALDPVHRASPSSPLIERLVQLRGATGNHVVLAAQGSLLKLVNPVARCAAQPFVYPAVSERPWTSVIKTGDADCDYLYYGYAQYGLGVGRPTAQPALLPQMKVIPIGVE